MKKPIIITISAIFLLVIAVGAYLLNGCQKNVEPIELISKISVSSFVFNSETYAGISDVDISVDGTVVTTSGTDGKFTISDLEPGDYLITAKKSGFSKSSYELTVEDEGAKLPDFILKELSEPVIIGASGGTAEAVKSSGEQAAELVIPAGELASDKEVSATSLVGNEVPTILESDDQLLGTTITLDSDDENIEFENGAQLTFQLPFMHKPGDAVEVTYFNEDTNEWEVFDNAIVSENGMSATVTIYHFSTYSANVEGSYSEEQDETLGYEIIGNSDDYDSMYEWSSTLEYNEGVPDDIDKEWLYTTVENQTKLSFSEINYSNSTTKSTSDVITPAIISSTISPPPIGNPTEYSNLPERPWELVKQCCWFKEYVNALIWIKENNGYMEEQVSNRYLVCSFFWIWRQSDDDPIPSACYPYYYYVPPVIIIPSVHEGGSGN